MCREVNLTTFPLKGRSIAAGGRRPRYPADTVGGGGRAFGSAAGAARKEITRETRRRRQRWLRVREARKQLRAEEEYGSERVAERKTGREEAGRAREAQTNSTTTERKLTPVAGAKAEERSEEAKKKEEDGMIWRGMGVRRRMKQWGQEFYCEKYGTNAKVILESSLKSILVCGLWAEDRPQAGIESESSRKDCLDSKLATSESPSESGRQATPESRTSPCLMRTSLREREGCVRRQLIEFDLRAELSRGWRANKWERLQVTMGKGRKMFQLRASLLFSHGSAGRGGLEAIRVVEAALLLFERTSGRVLGGVTAVVWRELWKPNVVGSQSQVLRLDKSRKTVVRCVQK
ncbi:hypothetical protein R3P38DRAFT_2771044 [Favolaschia claudopus]|uniref:Uncharacterized protein n=1 Tax=Favolaschia claudopus TaxID=2862362 RepID=A0AAW0CC07_9AGAR